MRILGALLAIGAGVFLVNLAQATPPAGVISNVMLAQGATAMPLAEKINVGAFSRLPKKRSPVRSRE